MCYYRNINCGKVRYVFLDIRARVHQGYEYILQKKLFSCLSNQEYNICVLQCIVDDGIFYISFISKKKEKKNYDFF